jgi:UDP-glucuronate decarboxylase
VEALMRLMNRDGVHHPVNLGNPEEFSIRELADKVMALINTPSVISHRPLPPDDPGRRRPDITKARTRLGFSPRVTLESGLRAMLKG